MDIEINKFCPLCEVFIYILRNSQAHYKPKVQKDLEIIEYNKLLCAVKRRLPTTDEKIISPIVSNYDKTLIAKLIRKFHCSKFLSKFHLSATNTIYQLESSNMSVYVPKIKMLVQLYILTCGPCNVSKESYFRQTLGKRYKNIEGEKDPPYSRISVDPVGPMKISYFLGSKNCKKDPYFGHNGSLHWKCRGHYY